LRRSRIKAMLTLPLAALLLALLNIGVLAAQYDGTDPNSTGCANNASTIYSINVTQGTLQLRFSNTCYTAWARFYCHSSGYCQNYEILVERSASSPDGSQAYYDVVDWPYSTPAGALIYTPQVYDAGADRSQACYRDDPYGSFQCTSWY